MEREASAAEQRVCEKLSELLPRFENGALPEHDQCSLGLFLGLERFISEVLCEVHQEWDHESLDGIDPSSFQKTGPRSVEVIGAAILITDQTLTALAVKLQISPDLDRVSWFDCRLGESEENGTMRRTPYERAGRNWGIANVLNRLDSIEWTYHVGYGEFVSID